MLHNRGTLLRLSEFYSRKVKIMKKLAIVLVSLVTGFSGIAPAQAFPVMAIQRPDITSTGITSPGVTSDVQQIRDRRIIRRGWNRHNGHYYGNRYYRGRYYHHHHNNNAGAIIGGLAAGAIIGGVLSSAQRPRYYGGNSHTSWCYNRYRSYRASDNTFQPYGGPRQQCVSPY